MRWAVLTATAALAATALCASQRHPEKKPDPVPAPALRIPVAPLGYLPPGAFYTTNRLTSMALDFFDDDRLLFTFHVNGLLQRIPGDEDDDADQEIRGVVLDARTGQALKTAQWRMRDHARYLWPFSGGKLLLRIHNTLYLVDPALDLEPWLKAPEDVRLVEVSPQRRWMVVEFDNSAKEHLAPSLEAGAAQEQVPVQAAFLAVGSRRPAGVTELSVPQMLPLMDDGLLEVKEGRQMGSWLLNRIPIRGAPRFVGSVRSFCHPRVQPLSESVALVSWCSQQGDGQPVFAVNLAGRQLWQDLWQNRYVWPYFDYAENGSRFVYESVEINVPMSIVGDSLDQDEIAGQMVGVYNTDTGKAVLVKDVNPVVTAGQNVALSPDGRRFAILRDGAIEIYDLPPVSAAPAPVAAAATKSPARRK